MARVVASTLHLGRPRPWGYEIPATLNDDTGAVHNVVLLFRRVDAPSQNEIDAQLAFWAAKITTAAEEVIIEPET